MYFMSNFASIGGDQSTLTFFKFRLSLQVESPSSTPPGSHWRSRGSETGTWALYRLEFARDIDWRRTPFGDRSAGQ